MELELAHSESKPTFGDASGHDGAAPASKRPREEAAPPRSLALEDPAAAVYDARQPAKSTPAGTPPGGPPSAADQEQQPQLTQPQPTQPQPTQPQPTQPQPTQQMQQPQPPSAELLAPNPENPYALPKLSGNLEQREQEQMVLDTLQAKFRSKQLTRRWLQEEAQNGEGTASDVVLDEDDGGAAASAANMWSGFSQAMQQHQAQAQAAQVQMQSGMGYMIQDGRMQMQQQQQHQQQQQQQQQQGQQMQGQHGRMHSMQQMAPQVSNTARPSKPSKKRSRKVSRQPARDPAIMATRPTLKGNYDPDKLTWCRTNLFTKRRSRNVENIYCYCAEHMPDEPCVQVHTRTCTCIHARAASPWHLLLADTSCRVVSCRVVSCRVVSCRVVSCRDVM
eukprot:COSAG06_NODE_5113_length_3712_cov_1.732079_3_plen_391_part_00